MGELSQFIDNDDKKEDVIFEIEDNDTSNADIDKIIIDDDFITNI